MSNTCCSECAKKSIAAHVYPINVLAPVRTLLLPQKPEAVTRAVNLYLTGPNAIYMRRCGGFPGLLSGVFRYGDDPEENWLTVPWALMPGALVDCEDIAAMAAAEDRVVRGIRSYAYAYVADDNDIHVVLARPKGTYRDEYMRYAEGEDKRFIYIDLSPPLGMV